MLETSSKRLSRLASLRSDAGYVLAMSALLLIPLMAFTGLAVDLGAWYARAAEIQRATDAASLAGVAYIPHDADDAVAAAHAVATQNGFTDGVDGITVVVTPLAGDRVRVRITDAEVPQYFTSIFRGNVSVSRSSVAEYVPPIRMGSPRNFLGTEDLDYDVSGLPDGAIKELFYLSINGPCDYGEDGDLRQSLRIGTASSTNKCTGGSSNPTYQSNGYAYGVRTGPGFTGQVVVEVFDGPLCIGYGHDLNLGAARFTTDFTVREPGIDTFSGDAIATHALEPSDCDTWGDQWVELARYTPVTGQAHVIQVQSSDHTNNERRAAANNFALRARPAGEAFVACSSDLFESDPALSSAPTTCPNVFAYEDLSVFANTRASAAEFFLASIGPEHSGRTLVVELFDPGEGGRTIQITDPNGNLVGPGNPAGVTSFQRSVVERFTGEVAPSGGWGPHTEHSVDIRQRGPAPGTGRLTDDRCTEGVGEYCRYNERLMRLEIELPENIDAAYGGRTWWRIRYEFRDGVDVTDRTTWSVRVEGGPVRLIE